MDFGFYSTSGRPVELSAKETMEATSPNLLNNPNIFLLSWIQRCVIGNPLSYFYVKH